jgi:hypothetical protein
VSTSSLAVLDKNMRTPHACRPLVTVYKTVAKVTSTDAYLDMTEQQFIMTCMQESGGNANPKAFRQIYHDLMKDAGLTAMNSPLNTTEEDNGDHSWEYYVEGKLVHEDLITAHNSYYKA